MQCFGTQYLIGVLASLCFILVKCIHQTSLAPCHVAGAVLWFMAKAVSLYTVGCAFSTDIMLGSAFNATALLVRKALLNRLKRTPLLRSRIRQGHAPHLIMSYASLALLAPNYVVPAKIARQCSRALLWLNPRRGPCSSIAAI